MGGFTSGFQPSVISMCHSFTGFTNDLMKISSDAFRKSKYVVTHLVNDHLKMCLTVKTGGNRKKI